MNFKLYLIKLGDDIFQYIWIGNNLSLLDLNKNRKLSKFPKLNNNDYEMIKNSGGTVLYKKDTITWWLVNINLTQILEDEIILTNSALKVKIINIIDSLKRDIKLNQIIKSL
jgi:hypothetical protein